jgi:hypothetical protein
MAGKINTGSLFFVGRTPGPRPTPSSAFPLGSKKPAGGPAADQGVCPTKWRFTQGKSSGIGAGL